MLKSNLLLNITFGLFLLINIFFFLSIILNKPLIKKITLIGFLLGTVNLTLTIIIKWIEANHIPLSNTFETIILLCWLLAGFSLCFWKKDSEKNIVIGCSLAILIFLALTSFIDDTSRPLVPALRSNWLTIHVLFCFISYASLLISFISGILYFIFINKNLSIKYDVLTYNMVSLGYVFLILGIISGSIWGNQVWGSYWNWDPKETWSLITLLVYTIYVHSHFISTLTSKQRTLIAIICFLFVLFTYFGVNYLLSGLHSYA